MPAPLVLAPFIPAAKAVAANVVIRTGGALLGKQALKTAGARAAVLLAGTAKTTIPTAPNWLTPLLAYGLTGFSLLQAVLRDLDRLKQIDTSQPTNPDARKSWLTQPAPPEGMTINVTGQMGTEGAEVTASLYYTDSRVSGSGCSAPTDRDQIEPYKRTITASGGQLKYYKGERSENDCGWLGVSLRVLRTMPSSGKEDDADWEQLAGLSSGGWRPPGGIAQAQFDVVYVPLGDPLPDLPLPNWEPLPDAEPLPEVQPDSLPERPRTPVIAPPLPATVPDAVPLDEPERLVPPVPIPAPVVPQTAPAVKPAVQPTTTNQTTNAGEIVPSKKPPVPTTPKDVHKIGNAGGRIAGRTMRPTPVGIAQEVGRIEQKISKMNKGFPTVGGLGDILRLLLGINELLNSQKGGTTYELKSVCECPNDEEDCEEETTTVSTDGGYYVDEILARIDAIPPLLQAHKDYKQPICNEKPCLEGDFRTISFISDERSPYGNSRLRKRFRYRSQSGTTLSGLVDHWKDFTWTAGDVCVQHSGHSWGTPQVWASSVDEGKRVIHHAGREAGIDPSEVGKWTVSGSNNPRFGVSGTMRVNTKGGYYWITERLGSDGKPLVAVV